MGWNGIRLNILRQPQLLVIPNGLFTVTRNKWEIRATILLGCGHHHTMTNYWHLKIGFWLSRMVWALVAYYASTNGQLVVGGCWDSKPPWDCLKYLTQNTHGSANTLFPVGKSSALDVSSVVYDPQFSTELILHWRTPFIHQQKLLVKGGSRIPWSWLPDPQKQRGYLARVSCPLGIKGKLAPETSHFMRVTMVSCYTSHFFLDGNHIKLVKTCQQYHPVISP